MSNAPAPPADPPLQIGSSLVPLYVERKMKVYAVTESEVDSLSTRNAQATAFYSAGAFFLSASLSVWVNAVFYTDIPPAASVAKIYGAPLVLILAIVLFALGLHAAKSRKSTWEAIKRESGSN